MSQNEDKVLSCHPERPKGVEGSPANGINWLLKALHLNDSMTPFNSHKDRHEKIGQGIIGSDTFLKIVRHPTLRDKPFFLETPQKAVEDYQKEILFLRNDAL